MVRVLKSDGVFAVLEPKKGWAGGWRVNRELKDRLEDFGLENISFKSFTISYPRKREIFLIAGVKAAKID